MFLASAKALAGLVTEDDLALGRVYPALDRIREVSAYIAVATAQVAYDRGLATVPKPADLLAASKAVMYEPEYEPYVWVLKTPPIRSYGATTPQSRKKTPTESLVVCVSYTGQAMPFSRVGETGMSRR